MDRYATALLSLLIAGCASGAPDPAVLVPPISQPEVVATPAGAAKPAPTTVGPATPTPAPRVVGSRAAATPRAAAPTARVAPVPLDLDALEAQLKATKAIGFFTKISLKNEVDDLMKQFRGHYGGKTTPTMTELHRSYDLLIMKVLSLLQDGDQKLAAAIVSSREAIWSVLSDQNKFANL